MYDTYVYIRMYSYMYKIHYIPLLPKEEIGILGGRGCCEVKTMERKLFTGGRAEGGVGAVKNGWGGRERRERSLD